MWNDIKNMDKKKVLVKWYGINGRKASWIVDRYGKYRNKEWNALKIMEEK
jgi:hypothetical protein